MIFQLITGLGVVLYFAFTMITVYMVLIGKKTPEQDIIGRLIWMHGQFVIGLFMAASVISLSLVFANIVINILNMKIMFGG